MKSALETTDKILDVVGDGHPGSGLTQRRLLQSDVEIGPSHLAEFPADFRTLRNALRELDPTERWGGLNPAIRPEDHSIIYVCDQHYNALQYPCTPK